VGWLGGIVGKELDGVMEWSEFGFCGLGEDGEAGRGMEDTVKVAASLSEGEDVGNGMEGEVNLNNELVRERFEEHFEITDVYFENFWQFKNNLFGSSFERSPNELGILEF